MPRPKKPKLHLPDGEPEEVELCHVPPAQTLNGPPQGPPPPPPPPPAPPEIGG